MRLLGLDILRIIACLMIIVMHAPLPSNNGDGAFLSALSYLSAPGIGLFFMISGALLLPVNGDTKSFFRKRFVKILYPMIFWSVLYLLANYTLLDQSIDWAKAILSLLFSTQGTPIFWFIYTLLGLYLLVPILNRWLQVASRKELEFYLGLWVVSLCYPFLKYIVIVNTGNTGILYYFSGYVGYFVLGYYLKTYSDRMSWKVLLPALIVVIAVPVVCKVIQLEVDFYDLFWYLSIFVVIQCVCWWKVFFCLKLDSIGSRTSKYISELSKMTFGIYLVHFFIMRFVLWHCDFILVIRNYYLQTALIIVFTFALSVICTYLIGFLPKGQFIIGYKSLMQNSRS